MRYKVILIFAILVSNLNSISTSNSFSVSLITDEFVAWGSPEYYSQVKAELKRPHTKYATITATLTILKTISDTVDTRLQLYQFKSNHYEPFGRDLTHNYCDSMQNDKLVVPEILKHGNFSKTCPLPPGTYILKDYQIPTKNFPMLPRGKWKVRLSVDLQKVSILEFNTTFQLVSGS